VGCNRPPAPEPERADTAAVEKQAAEQRERSEEAAELERRAANLQSQWTEMQTKVQTRDRTATAGLREEVAEDVKNAAAAAADLKTTTPDNWWDRYERALEQSVGDVQADVQRMTKQKVTPEPADKAAPAAPGAAFPERRDAFVTGLRAQVDAMEGQIDKLETKGTRETERDDVKARIDKLQDDLDRLRSVSADDWWDVSSERVSQYIARVEESINRLDDNKAADTPSTRDR
jgi:DNA repair exonuclease SbcCD ATPase subunit